MPRTNLRNASTVQSGDTREDPHAPECPNEAGNSVEHDTIIGMLF